MGKKKVIVQKVTDDLIKETNDQESAEKKHSSSLMTSKKHSLQSGRAYVQATYNNTIVSLTDDVGNVLAWTSAGALGFKGAKKATPYAASRVVEVVIEKIKKSGVRDVVVYVKGIGSGRESAVRSLVGALNVLSISDVTPIPHNGCRPPKVRRV